mmetsp:Transcript_41217/g.109057  ORF Transcript_41217/g.109057 Transcript_41217/m.109057 type:complete len:249 (-) Transcript_41217:604-1350(-)
MIDLPTACCSCGTDTLNEPVENSRVELFRQSVAARGGVLSGEGFDHLLVPSPDRPSGEAFLQEMDVHAKHLSSFCGHRGCTTKSSRVLRSIKSLKLKFTQQKHQRKGPHELGDSIALDTNHFQGTYCVLKPFRVQLPLDPVNLGLTEARVPHSLASPEMDAEPSAIRCHHLVEDVVIPFASVLTHDPRLLQEVRAATGAHQAAGAVQLQLDELPKATRIVVTHGLSVTEGFQQGVRIHDPLDVQRILR